MAEHYYGKYLGIVKDNQDDLNIGRVKVQVDSIYPDGSLMIAMPALPYGYFFVPENEAMVWVEFEGGDSNLPIWTGLQSTSSDWASEAKVNPPQLRMIKTKAGHLLIFDDRPGQEKIQVTDGANGHEITLDQQGILIKDGVNSNQSVTLNNQGVQIDDTNNNSLQMTSSGATLSISSGAKVDLSASAITIDTGQGAKITISAGIVTLECAGAVQVKGNPVMLSSSAALPVARITDFGVGNLGAPVVLTAVGNPMVLA